MIFFTQHALKRMQERRISRAQVIGAIKTPEHTGGENGGIRLFQRRYGDRTLEVVAEVYKK